MVESQPSKLLVAGSIPVSRSKSSNNLRVPRQYSVYSVKTKQPRQPRLPAVSTPADQHELPQIRA